MNLQSEYQRNYLTNRRAKAQIYLGGVCVVCGSNEDLEFDHIDPSSKVIEISNAIAKHYSWMRLVEELDKCQLLCKIHHVEKTRLEFNAKRTHGKSHLAIRLKCQCEICLTFKEKYYLALNKRRRVKRCARS